ncbi:hypothetical protein [Streptomyces sp. F001]
MADRWGVEKLTVGKSVWCELDVVRRTAFADYRGACEPPPQGG